jgi:hypothetical protein
MGSSRVTRSSTPSLDRLGEGRHQAGTLEGLALEEEPVDHPAADRLLLLDVLLDGHRDDVALDELQHLPPGAALQLVEPLAHRLAASHDVDHLLGPAAGRGEVTLAQRPHLQLRLPDALLVLDDEGAERDVRRRRDDVVDGRSGARDEPLGLQRGDHPGGFAHRHTEGAGHLRRRSGGPGDEHSVCRELGFV